MSFPVFMAYPNDTPGSGPAQSGLSHRDGAAPRSRERQRASEGAVPGGRTAQSSSRLVDQADARGRGAVVMARNHSRAMT